MFRYSGKKKRLINDLPARPLSTATILEPFAGSLAYSLHYKPARVVSADVNPKLRDLWNWFRTEATLDALFHLESLKPDAKVDAREWGAKHGLSEPEVTLLRLQISGAYVGQLSSWILYPQHRLDLSEARGHLAYVQRSVAAPLTDFRDPALLEASASPDTVAFVDPPYVNTSANYKGAGDHGSMNPEAITSFVKALQCPVLFTYGDGAQQTFPEFEWRLVKRRKVPILRGGGTRERCEWYALLNWR